MVKNVGDEMIGTQFGDLLVIDDWDRYKNGNTSRRMYLSVCVCGQYSISSGFRLRSGSAIRCFGCSIRAREQTLNRYSIEERLYKLAIKKRRESWQNTLTLNQYIAIIKKECYYCGEPPVEVSYLRNNKYTQDKQFFANGVDRLDSTLGYSKENCVPCCKSCNFMKHTLTFDQFVNRVLKIKNHMNLDDRPKNNIK